MSVDIVERIDAALSNDHGIGCDVRYAGCYCGFGDATLATLTDAKAEISALRDEMAKRDANETRNCVNYGPCSRHDGTMSDCD